MRILEFVGISFANWLEKKKLDWAKEEIDRKEVGQKPKKSWSDFCDHIGFNENTVKKWRSGDSKPEGIDVDVLAWKLGKEVYEVLNAKPVDPILGLVLSRWKATPYEVKEEIAGMLEGNKEHLDSGSGKVIVAKTGRGEKVHHR